MLPHPFVTVAIPCRDEEAYIEACIRSAQAQEWPRDQLEILVADAMSIDSTRELLSRLAEEDDRIRLVDNPARLDAAGLNECLQRARGEVFVRMDPRADYATDFVRRCVEVLERTGADNVGAVAHPKARTFFQRCVAAAQRSRFGLREFARRKGDPATDVEGACPGAARRDVFERVGVFDPGAVVNEDAELNQRILDAGGRVFVSREIVVGYYPRESMRALARQYFEYGRGNARTLLKHGKRLPRSPALSLLILAWEAAVLATSPWHPLGGPSVAAFGLATVAEAVRVGRAEGLAAIPVVWSIFPVLHASHGAGFAVGLVRYALRPDWGPGERLTQSSGAQPVRA